MTQSRTEVGFGSSGGFTVVELLISLSIFGIIIVGMTIALVQQQRQFNFTRSGVDLDQTGRSLIDFVAAEVRNAASRQGKHFSLAFTNGGSSSGGACNFLDTTDDGTVDSPPDCLTVYTWDITKGQVGDDLPSIATTPSVTQNSPLKVQFPNEWFPAAGPLVTTGDLIGFRSRIKLCSPNASIDCGATPSQCSECSAILKVASVDNSTKIATFENLLADLVAEQNFQSTAFTDAADFLADFKSNITDTVGEMSIIRSTTFSIDPSTHELLVERNLNGAKLPFAGGDNAPGIYDLQFVFNLMNPDGSTTKIGVPTEPAKLKYSSFSAVTTLTGRQKDIRTVEIYLLVRSKNKPQLLGGSPVNVQKVSPMGDRLQRATDHASLGEGYTYRLFNTTVFIRNLGREDYG